jgi:electron transfer flavoprotein alpha subunit
MSEILVYIEAVGSEVTPGSRRLLGFARQLADARDSSLTAFVASADEIDPAGLEAADVRVEMRHPALSPYLPEAHEAALRSAVATRAPDLVLVDNTTVGFDVGAGVAVACEMPLVAYCVELSADAEEVRSTSDIHDGVLLADARARLPAVVAMTTGILTDEPARAGRGDREQIAPPEQLDTLRMRFVEEVAPDDSEIDITKAERLVCVGRGIGSAGDVPAAEELAAALHAEVGASRPVVDAGWLPRARQVGETGKTVAPKLYIGLGISGAMQHKVGMQGSNVIVAINKDPNAPIFEFSHFGIVGDLHAIVPELTELVRRRTGS